MDLQSLAYALTQVAHNFGAVAVVGGAVFAGRPWTAPPRRGGVWLILGGWLLQAVSGAGFGAISFAYYGQFPDIHGIAVAALSLKVACAIVGIALAIGTLRYAAAWSARRRAAAAAGQILLGVAALTAAAFLRWFS